MNQSANNSSKTVTVTGRVSQEIKDRLTKIAHERNGLDEESLVGEAVERLLHDDYWEKEICRRLAVPEEDRRYVSSEDVHTWVHSLGSENPLPRPQGKPRSEV